MTPVRSVIIGLTIPTTKRMTIPRSINKKIQPQISSDRVFLAIRASCSKFAIKQLLKVIPSLEPLNLRTRNKELLTSKTCVQLPPLP